MILLLLLAAALPLSANGETDWCSAGQPATGTYTLAADSTCDVFTFITVPVGELLKITASGSGAAKPIINMGGTDFHFLVYGDLTLEGLILQNGQASSIMGYSGGSIVALRSTISIQENMDNVNDIFAAKPIISLNDVLFQNNMALNSGGAIACMDASLIIDGGCEFIGNKAKKGGAIAAGFHSNITFGGTNANPVQFKDNIAAIALSTGDLVSIPTSLDPTTFEGMVGEGGAVYLQNSHLVANDAIVIFEGNKAASKGGAVSVEQYNIYHIHTNSQFDNAQIHPHGQTITQTGNNKFEGVVESYHMDKLLVLATLSSIKSLITPATADCSMDSSSCPKFEIDNEATTVYAIKYELETTPSGKIFDVHTGATMDFNNNRVLANAVGGGSGGAVELHGRHALELKGGNGDTKMATLFSISGQGTKVSFDGNQAPFEGAVSFFV